LKVVERLHTERETHPLERSEHVGGHGDVEAGRLLEEERRSTAGHLAGAVGDRGDLQVGTHRFTDAGQQPARIEIREKGVKVGIAFLH
jgi:hypothetical protein